MDYASSIQAVALRVVKPDASGAPIVGATSAFVTSQFTRVSFTPEYEAGEEIQQKRADGVICNYYKMPDVLKKVNLEVAICNPQPEVYEMLAGGSLLTAATENVGWAAPEIGEEANPNGVGIEVWSRAIVDGRPAATNPYWRWVFPFVQTRMSGDRVLENGAMAHAFSGEGLGNANYGDGPVGDWDFPTTSAMQYARDNAAPTGIDDFQAVVADV